MSLEELLGPSDGRYFAAGYRAVSYVVEPENGTAWPRADGVGRVSYPEEWSLGPDGVRRSPHLSSVDSIVLPLLMCERLCSEDSLRILSRYRVIAVELRAGREPWRDLDEVPISLEIAGVLGVEDLEISAVAGSMRARLTLRQGADEDGGTPSASSAPGTATVYGGLFQSTTSRTDLTGFDASSQTLHGRHELAPATSAPVGLGVESAFWPMLTAIDYLVLLGQLTQATIHVAHGVDRAKMGNLWLRSFKIWLDEGFSYPGYSFESAIWIARDRVIVKDGRHIHDVGLASDLSTGVRAEALVAYEEVGDE